MCPSSSFNDVDEIVKANMDSNDNPPLRDYTAGARNGRFIDTTSAGEVVGLVMGGYGARFFLCMVRILDLAIIHVCLW